MESDSKVSALSLVKAIPFPDGRKQNHEIDADDQGSRFSSVAGRGNSSTHGAGAPSHQQKHGLDRHEEATEHKANVFARELCHLLHDGRTHGQYDELILVAEPHFLGRLRSFMDKETSNHVLTSVNHNWIDLSDADLKERVREVVRAEH